MYVLNQTLIFFAACEECITSRPTVIDSSQEPSHGLLLQWRTRTMVSVEHKEFSLVTVQHQLV